MAELPGWDDARLQTAAPRDVEAARWRVFAERLEPAVTRDVDGMQLDLAESEAKSPRAAKRIADRRRVRSREAVTQLSKAQADARRMLLLDEEEPADG